MKELNLKNLDVEVDDSAPTLPIPEVKPEDRVPLMHESDWSDYVLKQFEEDETIDGNPTVDGLRRVTRKLLGNIIQSVCNVISAPNLANEWAATVEHTIVIDWKRETTGYSEQRVFTEVADVNPFNCDAEFRRFASSTASTRAEARALRKALMLKRVVAAEEITEVAPEAEGDAAKGLITKNQMNFLKLIAKRIDINIPKYINMGKTKYDKLEDVPYATAVKMVGVLSEFQRKKEKIPDSIKGWKE